MVSFPTHGALECMTAYFCPSSASTLLPPVKKKERALFTTGSTHIKQQHIPSLPPNQNLSLLRNPQRKFKILPRDDGSVAIGGQRVNAPIITQIRRFRRSMTAPLISALGVNFGLWGIALIPAFFVVRQVGIVQVGAHGIKSEVMPEGSKTDEDLGKVD